MDTRNRLMNGCKERTQIIKSNLDHVIFDIIEAHELKEDDKDIEIIDSPKEEEVSSAEEGYEVASRSLLRSLFCDNRFDKEEVISNGLGMIEAILLDLQSQGGRVKDNLPFISNSLAHPLRESLTPIESETKVIWRSANNHEDEEEKEEVFEGFEANLDDKIVNLSISCHILSGNFILKV